MERKLYIPLLMGNSGIFQAYKLYKVELQVDKGEGRGQRRCIKAPRSGSRAGHLQDVWSEKPPCSHISPEVY